MPQPDEKSLSDKLCPKVSQVPDDNSFIVTQKVHCQVPDETDPWRPRLVQHACLATPKPFPTTFLQMELPKQCPGRTQQRLNKG